MMQYYLNFSKVVSGFYTIVIISRTVGSNICFVWPPRFQNEFKEIYLLKKRKEKKFTS